MPPSDSLGILYLHRSLDDSPPPVMQWIAQAGTPCVHSPDIYDALALLARGRKPKALLVDIECLDWSELDFFRHAANLCRDMKIIVHGPDHHQAKIEAACYRGAILFDRSHDVVEIEPESGDHPSIGGLLAGSLQPAQDMQEPFRPAPR